MIPAGFTLPAGYFPAKDRAGVIGVGGNNI